MFKRAFQSVTEDMVEEAQATVTGGLLERHADRDDLPGWVVVNALAHGDWAALTRLAAGEVPGRDRLRAATVTFLAGETLAVAGSPAGLAALQRAYLLPLELGLLHAGSSSLPPSAAVRAVRGQLARARAQHRHPTAAPQDE
ncbi:MAG TPA: hypothetical protein VFA84_12130 [Acidimicrobiales bacterium]|nr:hypothetical protein [Acidimicrobiales bacterium]